jgi:DNA ligase-1
LVCTSRAVAATASRLEKIERLATLLRRIQPDEADVAVAYLAGELRQGRLGVGPVLLERAAGAAAAGEPSLTVGAVDGAIEAIALETGPGSTARREALLRDLLSRATAPEQSFLVRLLLGEQRQGALEGVVLEAVARAAGVDSGRLRRAVMLAGDLRRVAAEALRQGERGLDVFALRPFHALRPMLAQTAGSVEDALSRLGRAALEYKLDGVRIQVHSIGDEVRVFSRRLNEITAAVPEVVEKVRMLRPGSVVLDGEVLALRPDGRPHRFQTTMRRVGRTEGVESLRESLPLAPFFFDCLHRDGNDLIDRPGEERFAALCQLVPAELVVPRIVTADAAEAEAFLRRALERGHEGIMAKSIHAPYEAGARREAWFKIKPARTLDLVVLAAEWGHGRRRGWLSNLHLGARDPATGGFVMLGKTFKGMTDQTLQWQTSRLLELESGRDCWTVYVRPELVAEIAFSDVQVSPQYAGGLALRFARLKRYRPDKRAMDADTIDTVRAVAGMQEGTGAGTPLV